MDSCRDIVAGIIDDDDLEAFAFLDEVTNSPTPEPQESVEINRPILEPPEILVNQPPAKFPMITPSIFQNENISQLALNVLKALALMNESKDNTGDTKVLESEHSDNVSLESGEIHSDMDDCYSGTPLTDEQPNVGNFQHHYLDCIPISDDAESNDFTIKKSKKLGKHRRQKRKRYSENISQEKNLQADSRIKKLGAISDKKLSTNHSVVDNETFSKIGKMKEIINCITLSSDHSDYSDVSLSSVKTVRRMQSAKIAVAELIHSSPFPEIQQPSLSFNESAAMFSSPEQTLVLKSPKRFPQQQPIQPLWERPKKQRKKIKKEKKNKKKKRKNDQNNDVSMSSQVNVKSMSSTDGISLDAKSDVTLSDLEVTSKPALVKRKLSNSSNQSILLSCDCSSNSNSQHGQKEQNSSDNLSSSGSKILQSKSLPEETTLPIETKSQKSKMQKATKNRSKSKSKKSNVGSSRTSLEMFSQPKCTSSRSPKLIQHMNLSSSHKSSVSLTSSPESKRKISRSSKRLNGEHSESSRSSSPVGSKSHESRTQPIYNLMVRNKSISVSPSKECKAVQNSPRSKSGMSNHSIGAVGDELSPPKQRRAVRSSSRSKSSLSNISKISSKNLTTSISLSELPKKNSKSRSKSILSSNSKSDSSRKLSRSRTPSSTRQSKSRKRRSQFSSSRSRTKSRQGNKINRESCQSKPYSLRTISTSRSPPSRQRSRSRYRSRSRSRAINKRSRSRNRKSRSRSSRRKSSDWMFKSKRARGIRSNSRSPGKSDKIPYSSSLSRCYRMRSGTRSRSRSRSTGKYRRRNNSRRLRKKRRRSLSRRRKTRSRSTSGRSLSSLTSMLVTSSTPLRPPSTSMSLSTLTSVCPKMLGETLAVGTNLEQRSCDIPLVPTINAGPNLTTVRPTGPILASGYSVPNINGYFPQSQNLVPFAFQTVPYAGHSVYSTYNYSMPPAVETHGQQYHSFPANATYPYPTPVPSSTVLPLPTPVPAPNAFINPMMNKLSPFITRLKEKVVKPKNLSTNRTSGIYEDLFESKRDEEVPSSPSVTDNCTVAVSISRKENEEPPSSTDDFTSNPSVLIMPGRKIGIKPMRERIVINLLSNSKLHNVPCIDPPVKDNHGNCNQLIPGPENSHKVNKTNNINISLISDSIESQSITNDDSKLTLKKIVNPEVDISVQTNKNNNNNGETIPNEILARLRSVVLSSKRSVSTQVDFLNMGLKGTVDVCDAFEDVQKVALFNALRELLK